MSKPGAGVVRRTGIELDEGKRIAQAMVERLLPYCARVEIVGSIRRNRPEINDVDIVVIPSDPWGLFAAIKGAGNVGAAGAKRQQVIYDNVQVDIYLATEQNWATLLLIRTGSAQNNIRLASTAKRRGWHLAANGDGLFDEHDRRVAGDTEDSIYAALGLPFQQPEERE